MWEIHLIEVSEHSLAGLVTAAVQLQQEKTESRWWERSRKGRLTFQITTFLNKMNKGYCMITIFPRYFKNCNNKSEFCKY